MIQPFLPLPTPSITELPRLQRLSVDFDTYDCLARLILILQRMGGSPGTPIPMGTPGSFVLTANGKVAQPWPQPPMGMMGGPSSPPPVGAPNMGPGPWDFTAPGVHTPTINRASYTRQAALPGSNDKVSKRWPTDFLVHEITEGFKSMDQVQARDPRERQKTAFEKVFGCRYVKSTVGRAKLYWKRSSQEVKDHFLSLPRDDQRGKWSNFVHLMDGKLVIEVENELGEQEGGMHHQDDHDPHGVDDDQAVMASLSMPLHPAQHQHPPDPNEQDPSTLASPPVQGQQLLPLALAYPNSF